MSGMQAFFEIGAAGYHYVAFRITKVMVMYIQICSFVKIFTCSSLLAFFEWHFVILMLYEVIMTRRTVVVYKCASLLSWD